MWWWVGGVGAALCRRQDEHTGAGDGAAHAQPHSGARPAHLHQAGAGQLEEGGVCLRRASPRNQRLARACRECGGQWEGEAREEGQRGSTHPTGTGGQAAAPLRSAAPPRSSTAAPTRAPAPRRAPLPTWRPVQQHALGRLHAQLHKAVAVRDGQHNRLAQLLDLLDGGGGGGGGCMSREVGMADGSPGASASALQPRPPAAPRIRCTPPRACLSRPPMSE